MSAVIVLLHVIPFVNFMLDVVFPFGIMDSRRTGKASGAATARRKLEPDGGSPNKYELGKRKPLGAGSTRRQEMG